MIIWRGEGRGGGDGCTKEVFSVWNRLSYLIFILYYIILYIIFYYSGAFVSWNQGSIIISYWTENDLLSCIPIIVLFFLYKYIEWVRIVATLIIFVTCIQAFWIRIRTSLALFILFVSSQNRLKTSLVILWPNRKLKISVLFLFFSIIKLLSHILTL